MLFSILGAACIGLILATSAANPAKLDAVMEHKLLPRWDTATVTVTCTVVTTPSWCTTTSAVVPPPAHPSSPTTTPVAPYQPPASSSTPASPVTTHVPIPPYVAPPAISSLVSSMNSEVSSYHSKMSSVLSTPVQPVETATSSSQPSLTPYKSNGNSSTPVSATYSSKPSSTEVPNAAGKTTVVQALALLSAALPIVLTL